MPKTTQPPPPTKKTRHGRAQTVFDNENLVWGEPVVEVGDHGTTTSWTTECGRYRVAKRVSNYLESNPAGFYALYMASWQVDEWVDPPHYSKKSGNKITRTNWEFTETDAKERGYYPKSYRHIESAFESIERWHSEATNTDLVVSNKEEIIKKAEANGLTVMPKAIIQGEVSRKPDAVNPALEAAIRVLQAAIGPMTPDDIYEEAFDKGFWVSESDDPNAELGALISTEIRTAGGKSRFRRASRGLYELNNQPISQGA